MSDETYDFETKQAVLSDSLDGDPPYHIHGVALGVGDITVGQSQLRKLWPAETLQGAAPTLAGRPLVRDHNNTTKGVVGEVIDSKFEENRGVLYKAELDDEELAEKVANERLDVSARIFHDPVEELERDEEADALVVENAVFDNLSLVPSGAAPSNTANIGDTDEMSADELRAAFDTPDDDVDPDTEEESACDGVEEADEEELLEDLGYVVLEEQTTSGWTVDIEQAHYEDSDYFISIHTTGAEHRQYSPTLSESLGHVGPFGQDETVENVTVELDQPLVEDTRVYATLKYANNGQRGNIIERGGNAVLNSAPVTVAPDQGNRRLIQFDDSPEDGTATEETADDPNPSRVWVRAAHLSDEYDTMKIIELTSEDLPEDVDEFDSPTVVEEEALEELKEQAKNSDEIVAEMREDLSTFKEYKDEAEELNERVEELEAQVEEVDDVKSMYAESLAETTPFDEEELMEFDIKKLREKVEAVDEEALNPAPRSVDVDEDELEEEDPQAEAELEELRDQLEWYESRGWEAAAETVREEIEELES